MELENNENTNFNVCNHEYIIENKITVRFA